MEQMKKGWITIAGDRPLELSEDTEHEIPEITEEQRAIVRQIGRTMKAYLDSAEQLLQGKLADIRDLAPIHLSNPGNLFVVACPDGVAIRFDRKTEDKRRTFAGWTNDSLLKLAPLLSQNLIHCYTDRNYTSTIPTTGAELKLFAVDAATKVQHDILSIRAGIDAVIEKPPLLPAPPHKPFCLVSVHNSLELGLVGVMVNAEAKSFEQGQEFITRTKFRFPFGWECIEIYPFVDVQHWRPEYAPLWAENNLFASAVASQFRESYFQQLDPNAAARRLFASLLKSYQELLDTNPKEEILQSFLGKRPNLLCPAEIRVWPKLELGNHVTDFVFREAPGDYLLVELERSTHRLFVKNGDPSRELDHALSQIIDWKRYIEDNLPTVQRELGLSGISASPKSLVVIGRSAELSSENRRKLQTIESNSHKLKIMTYDDVYANAKAVVENLLGPLGDPGGTTQIYYPPKGSSSLPTPNNAKAASHDVNVTLGEQL
ncbi:MAG: DUF4263 domain-containing protein [Chloroflexi bacterium]|nr:DUF4263 domain-containing protein [Chloroflexota bacterium]